MSLSFVASAVQTVTADGAFEEKEINKEQVDAVNKRNAHKPLFEQLRQNQDEEQAQQEAMQREMMRGTRALDDEDVAHLDALQKQRLEREREIQQRTQEELMLFRAAKAERQQFELDDDDQDNVDAKSDFGVLPAKAPLLPPVQNKHVVVAPKIVVKKRKRRVEPATDEGSTSADHQPSVNKNEAPPGGIGSLLSGYGSSDDDSD
jgi:FAM192A/Fyv6, N-terminal domain